MRKLWAAMQRLENHWIGDAIGAVCLFGILIMMLFATLGFGGAQ